MTLLDFYAAILFLTFLLQLIVGIRLMASFSELAAAQAATATAIADLASRVGGITATTAAALDTAVAAEQANAAAVAAITTP